MDLMAIRRGLMMASKKRLPSAYQEVEWIEGDGGQYIDSGIECTGELAVDFKVYYENIDNLAVCGGIDNTNSPFYFRHHFSPTSTTKVAYWAQYNKNNSPSVNVAVSKGIHTIYIDPLNGIYIVDGIQGTFTPIESGKTTGKSYGIFGRIGNTGTIHSKPSRFYYFKFYKNDQMMGSFIPCYRKSDNEIGMYDTVSKTFYTNAGTGTFLKGADV